MSTTVVNVQPMKSRTVMTLEEIREAMIEHPPDHEELTGGWASTNNEASHLGTIGLPPPPSAPIIEDGQNGLPKRLLARFYYWEAAPMALRQLPDYDPVRTRKLNALDLTITDDSPGYIGILASSRSKTVLNKRDGALTALESILRQGDDTIRVDKGTSPLQLDSTDIFLWLTVQQRDNPHISPELRLDSVSGISGRDATARTAVLQAGVDFTRPNFLTAVAEADTLGPIDISFVHYEGQEVHSYQAKVHLDGGFGIRKNEVHFPTLVETEEIMLKATYTLAYRLVPLMNKLYSSDLTWNDRRLEVIEGAMVDLAQRYNNAREALRERLEDAPVPLSDEDD